MKIRSGFVSNSSSSSYILWGFSPEDSDKAYDMVKEKVKKEEPHLSEINVFWRVNYYFRSRGIDYCFKEQWNYEHTDGIGCVLDEGDKETFNKSLEEAEGVIKKFDEEHHTDFARNCKIFSVFEDSH